MAPPSTLLERMRRNPTGDWTIADVELLCRQHGLLFRPGKGTSHAHAKYPRAEEILTIPARPDLPGCMSDGATPEEALRNVQEAIASWIEAAKEWRRDIPRPSPPMARSA